MNPEKQHLPWTYKWKGGDAFTVYDADGNPIALCYTRDHGDLIISGVNAHDDLLDVCEAASTFLAKLAQHGFSPGDAIALNFRIKATIAKAKKGATP